MLARAFYLMLIGALGGFLSWAVTEPFAPRQYLSPEWGRYESMLGLIAGALIGVFIGGFSGWRQGSRLHFMKGAGVGLIAGAIAGSAGVHLGSTVMNLIASPLNTVGGAGGVMSFIGRCLGWGTFGGLIGCAVGLAEGVIGQSASRLYQGTLGGVIGGLLGGAMFEVAGNVFAGVTLSLQGATSGQVQETGMIPRAVGLVATGAGIGLLIGIVEALGRKAWVRVIYGRNEGKEFMIDVPQAFIGRSESAHVPIFGDTNIMPMHAMIRKEHGHYMLIDGGSPLGTGLNGNRISAATLNHGDTINIGTFNIQFFLRSGKGTMPAESLARGGMPIPHPNVGYPHQAQIQTQVMPGMTHPTVAGHHPQGHTQAISPQPSGFALVAISGPLTGQRFEVLTPFEIGRETGPIPLSQDANVSRRHASLAPMAGGIAFNDLGSTNGSKVNGVRAQSAQLRKGDTLEIGITMFRVE